MESDRKRPLDLQLSCIFILVILTLTVQNVCGVCSNITTYVPIAPANYDRNYSSITEEGKHPLGFRKSTWHYNTDTPNPCFKITGAANRRLEIMFENFPPSRLCVMVQGNMICSDGGIGRFYRCIRTQAKTVTVEFTCDSQCAENSVNFWYRFVLGDLPADDPEDHWCDTRNQDEYPEDLFVLPHDFPLSLQTTTPFNKAPPSVSTTLQTSVMTAFSVLSVAFLR